MVLMSYTDGSVRLMMQYSLQETDSRSGVRR